MTPANGVHYCYLAQGRSQVVFFCDGCGEKQVGRTDWAITQHEKVCPARGESKIRMKRYDPPETAPWTLRSFYLREGGQQGLGLLSIECKAQRAAAHPAIPTVPAYAQTQAHPFEPSGAVAETPASAGTHAHVPKTEPIDVEAVAAAPWLQQAGRGAADRVSSVGGGCGGGGGAGRCETCGRE